MKKEDSIGFLDYLIIFAKWKLKIIPFLVMVMILSYLAIYFFIDEEYKSTALIIPARSEDVGGLLGAFKGLKNLPISLGGGIADDEISLYKTIIESRTTLETIIEKFNLISVYKLDSNTIDYKQKALTKLFDNIKTKETSNGAFEISILADTPVRAANMTNFLIDLLNKKIISLDIIKSKNSRKFLEKRIIEIKERLRKSEDSLVLYQEKTGIFEPEEQLPGILQAYTKLETELIAKNVQKSVLEKIYTSSSPNLRTIEIEVEELTRKLNELKENGKANSLLVSLKSLPNKSLKYYRLFREVKISSTMLEYLIPVYEKSKFDEQKDIPVFQVIDKAIPPVKKSYPPRTLLTLLITFGFFILIMFVLILKENEKYNSSEKIKYLKQNLFSFRSKRFNK